MKADRELHHLITHEGRFRILQIILEHTDQLPTEYEIAQFSPEVEPDELSSFLDDLVEYGVVEEVTLSPEERRDGYPHTFYGLTDYGWRFLVNHDLLDSVGITLRWDNIDVDDTTKLAMYESAPRPDDIDIFQGDPVSKTPEQQLEEYRMIVEQTRDALYMLDAEGRYVLVNEAYEELTGYSRDQLIGSTTSKVLDPESMAERRELIVELLNEDNERQSHAWQSTLHTADDDQLPVEVNFAALEYNDEFIGIVGSARNIADRKRREQELSVLSRVLRHNLGNKINIIQGYAEVIEDYIEDDKALEYAERIRRTSDKLIEQSEKARDINELLQEWPPERRPRDVTTVARNVLPELENEFTDVTFETDMPESAWARLPDEIAAGLEELIRNAVEHSDRDEPIVRVTVKAPGEGVEPGEGDVEIFVEDDGPGIPDHEIDILSSDEETPLEHSEGIGLWMVTWIVNAADGELTFERSDLGGAAVELSFRKAEPPALTLSM